MGHRTILLASAAPAKPQPGAPCNGCGVCCAAEPCPLGVLVTRRRSGACAALVWNDTENAYRCGLLASRWLPAAWVRRWIAAGAGCDCTLETA
jgi:hypothetical protein